MSHNHFKGKTVPEHLKEAREKGAKASEQIHGVELSGSFHAGCDSAKESCIYLGILFFLAKGAIPLFAIGLLIWKTARASFLGWSRLNRLNQLIEEEHNEIRHSRDAEQAELTEIYQAKGFQSPLLEQVVQVLMADENRLLTVMLEEELGLRLEQQEHPLKQGLGAFVGVFSTCAFLIGALYFSDVLFFIALVVAYIIATTVSVLPQKRSFIAFNTWGLSILFLTFLCVYQLKKILL